MFFKSLRVCLFFTKVTSALEGLRYVKSILINDIKLTWSSPHESSLLFISEVFDAIK